MKKTSLFLLAILWAVLVNAQPKPEKAPIDRTYHISAEELELMQASGVVLPPVKPDHNPWINLTDTIFRNLPVVYDMRQTPWLTSVKTQSPGACWAYSVMGAVESRLLMLGFGYYDLSDNNLKYCHKYVPERSTWGNHWMATSYFARRSGPLLESQDPYPGGTTGPENCPSGLTPAFYIPQARYTPPFNATFTKQTVLQYGPVWTLMYYHPSFFNPSNNTYYYGGTNQVNHAGIIVGWNDTLITAGGTGAWIVKNTYGPTWGEGGYYYVSYQDSRFHQYNGYWPDAEEFEQNVHMYQYDEIGGYWGVGFGNNLGYGLVKYEGIEGITEIVRLGTFIQYAGSGVAFKIYRNFTGQLSGLIYETPEYTCPLPGYYTFDLDSSVFIAEGQTFYIQVKYDSRNAASKWPISIEDTIQGYSRPHIQTGKFWVGPNPDVWPTAWYQVGSGTPYRYDLCIKAYARKHPPSPSPVAYAGTDKTITETDSVMLSDASAANYSAVLWLTSGDGTFSDPNQTTTIYFPGSEDIERGWARLSIRVTGLWPFYPVISDTLHCTILRYPRITVNTPANHLRVCDAALITSGSATDQDNDLLAVAVSLNNSEWIYSNNPDQWDIPVTLVPGFNHLRFKAIDQHGLESAITERTVLLGLQSLIMPPGWSVISGFLIPDVTALDTLLLGVSDNLILIQHLQGIYAPPPLNIHTLQHWNWSSAYKVKMAAADTLTYCGDLPPSHQIPFSQGLHLMPFVSNTPATITELFNNPYSDVFYIFDPSSMTIFLPLLEIYTLEQLQPGRGYLAYFLKEVTVNYPVISGFFTGR